MIEKGVSYVLPKQKAQFVVAMSIGAWLTFWVASQVRKVETGINEKFAHVEKKQEDFRREVQNQLDSQGRDMWTLRMMATYNQILSGWYPTNLYPNVYKIFWDAKDSIK